MSLCLGGTEFWDELERDILEAREYVYVQTLSFEGDRAGKALSNALLMSPARSKRVVADSVTKHVINDRIIHLPRARRDQALQQEIAATHEMFEQLQRGGVALRFAWPIGWRLHRLIVRNHKKLVAIDDRVSYIGGINFSEHNFDWHDLMLRIESPAVTRFLRDDFEQTWQGRDWSGSTVIDDTEIIIGSGRGNRNMQGAVSQVVDEARERIVLQCPYVGEPFWRLLRKARKRGVRVTVIMPERHNRSIMKWGTLYTARRYDLDIRFLPGPMTHLKALVSDDTLIVGSANFDFVSYRLQPEIVFVLRHPDIVNEFKMRVLEPDLARSYQRSSQENNICLEWLAMVGMKAAESVAWVTREHRRQNSCPSSSGLG